MCFDTGNLLGFHLAEIFFKILSRMELGLTFFCCFFFCLVVNYQFWIFLVVQLPILSLSFTLPNENSFVLLQSIGKGSLWCIDPDYRPNLLQALRKTPYHPYHQLQMLAHATPSAGYTILPGWVFYKLYFGLKRIWKDLWNWIQFYLLVAR